MNYLWLVQTTRMFMRKTLNSYYYKIVIIKLKIHLSVYFIFSSYIFTSSHQLGLNKKEFKIFDIGLIFCPPHLHPNILH